MEEFSQMAEEFLETLVKAAAVVAEERMVIRAPDPPEGLIAIENTTDLIILQILIEAEVLVVMKHFRRGRILSCPN